MSETTVPDRLNPWQKLFVRLMHVTFRFTRDMTLGVRAACYDEQGRIFLVRHTYVPGWYMPGGGVERGETAFDALIKELREEGNLEVLEKPALFHVYFNTTASRRDHVLLYTARVRQTHERAPDREIAESGFFHLDDLPDGLTRATLDRLAELRGEREPAHYW